MKVFKTAQECQEECDRINHKALRDRMKLEKFAGPRDPRRSAELIDSCMLHARKVGVEFGDGAREAAMTASREVGNLGDDVAATIGLTLKSFITKYPD